LLHFFAVFCADFCSRLSKDLHFLKGFEKSTQILLKLGHEFGQKEREKPQELAAEQVNFVIRLNLGSHPAKFWDADGREAALSISPGETVIHPQVWYKGQVCVNLIGIWNRGFAQPLWGMTNLEAQQGLRIYLAHMKIDESFRDLKSLLGMTKLWSLPPGQWQIIFGSALASFTILVQHPVPSHV
jgi:hypothetical protein